MSKSKLEGVLVVYQTGCYGKVEFDKEKMPFELYGYFRPPAFLAMAFVGMYGGSEEIRIRGESAEKLQEVVKVEYLDSHPRLGHLIISKPEDPEWPAIQITSRHNHWEAVIVKT